MNLLVIGSKGQLGWELMTRAGSWGLEPTGYDLPGFDIKNPEAVKEVIDNSGASVVVNAAAYTAVDQAEKNSEEAFAVNCGGAANLAHACLEASIPLVHVSTDYVFDGESRRPYKETDPVSPLGVYGQSKAAGEQEILKILTDHIIVRTSWLCGLHGANFVKTMLRLGKEREEIRVVSDQYGCPTFAGDLADGILDIVSDLCEDCAWEKGIVHYCGEGVTSWYEFAAEIRRLASCYDAFPARLVPIPTKEFPTPARRPAYSVLDCTRIKSQFGVCPLPWQQSLAGMLKLLLLEAH